MPRLLVEKGPDRGKSLTVAVGAQVVAGRDKDANLQLSDTMASRRHFLIASKGSIFGLKDLQSANGTLVNGRKAEGAHRLAYGDSIQVGETLISWMPDEQTDKHGGLIGQQIGGYRIEERLGRGAMGTVYKATQLSLGRTVALKVLSQDLVKDEKFCEMFVKEARAAGSLNHPNIIQVYDVGDEAGQYFFSMEYAAKGSVLEELGSKKSIGMTRAVRVIKYACSALDYAERKGLVHRDIKPDNLMVTEDDTVKLGDLGLAMSTQELQAEQDGVFGTPHYIAPEQAMGKPIDHRADIYALGATFYRMLGGRTLFTGATVKEILKKQVREAHTPITEHVPDCPQAIARIIDRMLAKNPAERYQHAQEIITDLSDWENLAARKAAAPGAAFAERPAGLSAEQSQQLAHFNANRKLLVMSVVAVVAVLAAVFSIYWFVIRDTTPVVVPNNSPVAANNNPTPANNSPGTELSPAVVEATEALKLALGMANLQIQENQGRMESYAKAIARIEEALAQNPSATQEMRDQAMSRLNELKQKHTEMSQGAAAIRGELDEVFRDGAAKIKDFKYVAGADAIDAFIKKYELSANEEVQEVVDVARDYYISRYPVEARNHLDDFIKLMLHELDDVGTEDPALRAATAESVLARIRDAQAACDSDNYKATLKARGDTIEAELLILRRKAAEAENRVTGEAFERCSAALQAVLMQCSRDAARGDFRQVQRNIADFQLSNHEYIAYKGNERFKPIEADMKARLDQVVFEHASLLKLVAEMPDIIQSSKLLKDHPWPDDVAKFMGTSKYMRLLVKSDIDNQQFTVELGDGRKLSSGDIDTRDKRLALAGAIAHLLGNHAGAYGRLMQPAGKDLPPALVGVFAWILELEAYDAGFPLIEHAWNHLPASDANRAQVREYYAWGLLGKASALGQRGDRATAQSLVNKLESEFADTRANKGRK